jgi:polysaccharide pyruvyl transferase WcaK-like protein
MRSATIIGYHGMENFGDDLFLQIITGWLSEHHGIRRGFLNAVRVPTPLLPTGMDMQAIHPEGRRIRRLDWLRQGLAAFRSDVVVLAAGSIFAGPQFHQPGLLLRGLRLADRVSRRHTPVLGLGLSLGPFPGVRERRLTATALACADVLLLRDQSSMEEASRMGLRQARLSQDLVPAIAPGLVERRRQLRVPAQTGRAEPVIGFSLGPGFRHWSDEQWREFAQAFVRNARQPQDPQRIEARILCTCSEANDGDLAMVNGLSQALEDQGVSTRKIVYTSASQQAFLDSLLGCDALISSRLHPALVAMGTGIPVLQLHATSPKILGVFDRVGVRPLALSNQNLPTPDEWATFWIALQDAVAGLCAERERRNTAAFLAAGESMRADLDQLSERILQGAAPRSSAGPTDSMLDKPNQKP